MEKLSVIFTGTGAFGFPILVALATDKRFHIPFVITGSDTKAGRHLVTQASPIKQAAIKNKLIVHDVGAIHDVEEKIIQEKPDFLLVVSYGEIIPKNILEIPRLGAVNVHGSLLPKYRGASPIQSAILHGEKHTGITWIRMNEHMDRGPVISQKPCEILENDTSETLFEKMARSAAALTPSILFTYAQNQRTTPQDESAATYCKRIEKEDGLIDVHREGAAEIVRKIRAFTPWPGCSIPWNDKRLKVLNAAVVEQKMSSGETRIVEGKKLIIGTAKNALAPLTVQPESKRAMGIGEFLRGQKNIPSKIH